MDSAGPHIVFTPADGICSPEFGVNRFRVRNARGNSLNYDLSTLNPAIQTPSRIDSRPDEMLNGEVWAD